MEEILLKRREVFFNNLIILGLDKLTLEKKHGINFNKDMFVLPNKKGFEIVTHFLFSKLSLITGKDYNLPWPLLEKEQDRVFQKTCYAHFTSFAEENDVKFPHLVPSVIATFGGDRFYEVYLAFSSYVMSKTIKKNGNVNLLSRPNFNRETFPVCEEIIKLSTIASMQRFKDTQKVTAACHLVWTKIANDLSECLQKLKVLLKTNEELLIKNWNIAYSLYSTLSNESMTLHEIIEKNIDRWKPEMDKWKKLENFFSSESKLWQYIASEVEGGHENQILNGQNFDIGLTDNLPEDCRIQLEKVGHISSKIDEKLSVVRYIKFLMAYVKYMTKVLREADLSKLHENCSVEEAHAIQDSLLYVNNLNKRLSEEVIPNIQSNIQKLKLASGFENSLKNLDASVKELFPAIPVHSFNTEAVKERMPCFKPGAISKLLHTGDKTDDANLSKSPSHLNEIGAVKFSSTDIFNHDVNQPDLSPLPGNNTSKSMSQTNLCLESLKKEQKLPIDTTEFNVPSKDSVHFIPQPQMTVSNLDDIDFTPSTFQMRDSWLQEESLNDMALSNVSLPDMSFDE